jgi:hypothetical protein
MMTKTIRSMLIAGVTASAALMSAAAFTPAWAGCGDNAVKTPASWQGSDAEGVLMPIANTRTNIVGMWSVSFVAGGNQIDFGYQVWHSDHTEFTNSGGRAPATQNFCLGMWERTGPFTFSLNHYALSYDDQGNFNGRVNIKEQVVIAANGKTYSGPFTIDVFDPDTNANVAHVAGTVTGTRMTMGSPAYPPY